MDLLTKIQIDSPIIQIIGDKSQSLLIILPKNRSLIIKKENLRYFSKEIESETYYDQAFLTVKQTQVDKYLVSTFLTKLNNKTYNTGYVGLNMIKGKIIQINPILYKNLFVKFSFILGYSSEIKLKPNSEKNDELNTFYPKTNIFYYIESKHISEINEIGSITEINNLNEQVFLQSENLIIEKRLGENETICLNGTSIIAFEESVTFNKFEKTNGNPGYDYLIAKGPGILKSLILGLIMFEMIPLKNSSSLMINLLIILIWIILSFLLEYYGNNEDQFIRNLNF